MLTIRVRPQVSEVAMNPIAESEPIADKVLVNNSYFYITVAVFAAAALLGLYMLKP